MTNDDLKTYTSFVLQLSNAVKSFYIGQKMFVEISLHPLLLSKILNIELTPINVV